MEFTFQKKLLRPSRFSAPFRVNDLKNFNTAHTAALGESVPIRHCEAQPKQSSLKFTARHKDTKFFYKKTPRFSASSAVKSLSHRERVS